MVFLFLLFSQLIKTLANLWWRYHNQPIKTYRLKFKPMIQAYCISMLLMWSWIAIFPWFLRAIAFKTLFFFGFSAINRKSISGLRWRHTYTSSPVENKRQRPIHLRADEEEGELILFGLHCLVQNNLFPDIPFLRCGKKISASIIWCSVIQSNRRL